MISNCLIKIHEITNNFFFNKNILVGEVCIISYFREIYNHSCFFNQKRVILQII